MTVSPNDPFWFKVLSKLPEDVTDAEKERFLSDCRSTEKGISPPERVLNKHNLQGLMVVRGHLWAFDGLLTLYNRDANGEYSWVNILEQSNLLHTVTSGKGEHAEFLKLIATKAPQIFANALNYHHVTQALEWPDTSGLKMLATLASAADEDTKMRLMVDLESRDDSPLVSLTKDFKLEAYNIIEAMIEKEMGTDSARLLRNNSLRRAIAELNPDMFDALHAKGARLDQHTIGLTLRQACSGKKLNKKRVADPLLLRERSEAFFRITQQYLRDGYNPLILDRDRGPQDSLLAQLALIESADEAAIQLIRLGSPFTQKDAQGNTVYDIVKKYNPDTRTRFFKDFEKRYEGLLSSFVQHNPYREQAHPHQGDTIKIGASPYALLDGTPSGLLKAFHSIGRLGAALNLKHWRGIEHTALALFEDLFPYQQSAHTREYTALLRAAKPQALVWNAQLAPQQSTAKNARA